MDLKTIVVGGEHLSPKQEKLRKAFMYLVSGVVTTAVNWACYILFDKLVKADMTIDVFGTPVSLKFVINQIICWIISVIVAYFLNRITVFRSNGNVIRELFTFAGARVISFVVLEIGLFALMLWGCSMLTGKDTDETAFMIGAFAFKYQYFVKLINSVFIVVANYVMSKIMVFRKEDMVDYSKPAEKEEPEDKEPSVEEGAENA